MTMQLSELLTDERRMLVRRRLFRLKMEHGEDERRIPQSERERAKTASPTDDELEWLERQAEIRLRIQENPEVALHTPSFMCDTCCDMRYVRCDVPIGDPDFGKIRPCPNCLGKEYESARVQWLRDNCGLEACEIDGADALELRLRSDCWVLGNWGKDNARLQQQRRIAFDAMKAALQERRGLLTFYGTYGAGKSRALAIIVNEARLSGIDAYYTTLSGLLDRLRNAIGKQDTGLDTLWERIQRIPVLALDEPTRPYATGWAAERIEVLVDMRYRLRNGMLTVFATNIDPREVARTDDIGYLASRMSEGTLIQLEGDMRPVVGARKEK